MRSFGFFLALFVASSLGYADGGPFDRGPAKVVATTGDAGVLAPQGEFRGSVYFVDVSDLATEVSGKVTAVFFEEGERVRQGQALVKLDDELLRKDRDAMDARLRRDRTQLQDAEVRLARVRDLAERGLNPIDELDQVQFQVESLRHTVASTEASLARIETLIEKTSISAPFDGVVLERMTDLGEWMDSGDTIAVLASDSKYEIVIDAPEQVLPYVERGLPVELRVGDASATGAVQAVIPRGDILTRTFPVKISVETDALLYESMAALAMLPTGPRTACLLVPRDAVLNRTGDTFVYTVEDGIAREHPVEVIGYDGSVAGIRGDNLGPGRLYVVKGHESLSDGERVEIVPVPTATERSALGGG